MYRVNVIYPAREGARFDMDYYVQKHVALVKTLMSEYGLGAVRVDGGIAGIAPPGAASFICVASFEFDSVERAQAGLAAHGSTIFGDLPNFSDIQPVLQFSESRL